MNRAKAPDRMRGRWLGLPGLAFALSLLLLAAPALADLSCTFRASGCQAGETALYGLSGGTDAHLEAPGQSYPGAICCSGATLSVRTIPSGSCNSNELPLLWLSATTDAHGEQGDQNPHNYPVGLCLAAPNAYRFSISYPTAAPSAPATCAGSLSAATDAHGGDCPAYSTKISITAQEDSTPPSGGSVSYPDAFSSTPTVSVAVNPGTDPETGIAGAQLAYRSAPLAGTCGSYGSWQNHGVQTPSTTSVSVGSPPLATANCYQFKYTAKNGAGLSAEYASANEFKLDTTLPSAGTVSAPSGLTNAATATVTTTPGTDAESGIASSALQAATAPFASSCGAYSSWAAAASPVSLTTNTCYKFRSLTVNKAGLSAASAESAELKSDSTSPATTDNADTQTHGGSYDIALSCSDSGSGCKSYQVCKYDEGSPACDPAAVAATDYAGATATYRLTCPTGSVCKRFVRYRSTDAAGNVETAKQTPLITQDASLPTCELTPLPQYTRSTSVPLSWTASDPGGQPITGVTVLYRTGTGTPVTWQTFTGTSATYPAQDNTAYDFFCIAKTASKPNGGSVSSPASTFVDASPPAASVSLIPRYASTAWVNESFSVSWSGSDAGSGVVNYTVERSTGAGFAQWATSANPAGGSKQETELQNGKTYAYRVTAIDAAGNSFTSPNVSVSIDTTPPACTLASLPALTGAPGTISLSWTASDTPSGIDSVAIEVTTDNATWQTLPATTSPATFQGVDGTQPVFRCSARDKAGTISLSPTVSTQVDLSPPTLTAAFPATAALGSNIAYVLNATDRYGVSNLTLKNGSVLLATLAQGTGPDQVATLSYTYQNAPLGSLALTATATDANGNSVSKTLTTTTTTCVPSTERACGSNIGECREGKQVCTTSGDWGACTGQTAPATETCNNKDDNCNGQKDEGLTRTGTAQVVVNGACTTASETCSAGQWVAQGTPPASFDICGNNKDDNCNGQVDETCACPLGSPPRQCGTSSVGECRYGTQTCTTSGWSQCSGSVDPVPEICNNNKDDNCNGQVDENCAASKACGTGPIPETGCVCEGRGYTYGYCCSGVFRTEACAGQPPVGQPPTDLFSSPWILLSVAGVLLLLFLLVLFVHFKRKGKDLTWEELSKEWS